MSTTEKINEKFEALIKEGNEVLRKAGWDGNTYRTSHPATKDYIKFRTEALNIIKRVCGEESDHYKELRRLSERADTATNGYYFDVSYGVVEAAKNDFEGGYLFDLRSLVAAEVLGDFMDQAEVLLQQGYHVPAASLLGAILEDTLRKICESRNIEVPEKTKIDKLNADLAKNGIYDKLIQKKNYCYSRYQK